MSSQSSRGVAASQPLSSSVSSEHGASSQPALTPLISVQDIKKSYGFKPILRRINLTVFAGQALALLGSNGAGKTTLLRILSGLSKPDAGTIQIAGCDLLRDPQQARSMIGFIAHQPYLYEEMTILENLLFFGRLYNVRHAHERAQALIDRVGLQKKTHERVRALSRGQVQRVAWTRALLHSPSVLLLDEPDTGLDQDGNVLIGELLAEHTQRGGSIILTTHHLDMALRSSQYIAILSGGRIMSYSQTSELSEDSLKQIYREVAR